MRKALAQFFFVLVFASPLVIAEPKNRITILYDSFGKNSAMQKDWGFAAYIEFEGKRILFDAGNNADIFKQNSSTAKVGISTVDFAVISHRHNDHTTGLNYLFEIHPNVTIYAPNEKFDSFASTLPANFVRLSKTIEIFPNIYIISTTTNTSSTKALQELSLVLKSSQGLIIVVGCSHPGIQHIVDTASKIDSRIVNIFGGFHLLRTPPKKISAIAAALKDDYKLKQISPGHCTGEPATQEFLRIFQNDYVYAGLGAVIELPQ